MSHRASEPAVPEPHSSARREWWGTPVGDSLLWGMEVPVYPPDPLSREVCCLLVAHIWDVVDRLSRLVWPPIIPCSSSTGAPSILLGETCSISSVTARVWE